MSKADMVSIGPEETLEERTWRVLNAGRPPRFDRFMLKEAMEVGRCMSDIENCLDALQRKADFDEMNCDEMVKSARKLLKALEGVRFEVKRSRT